MYEPIESELQSISNVIPPLVPKFTFEPINFGEAWDVRIDWMEDAWSKAYVVTEWRSEPDRIRWITMDLLRHANKGALHRFTQGWYPFCAEHFEYLIIPPGWHPITIRYFETIGFRKGTLDFEDDEVYYVDLQDEDSPMWEWWSATEEAQAVE